MRDRKRQYSKAIDTTSRTVVMVSTFLGRISSVAKTTPAKTTAAIARPNCRPRAARHVAAPIGTMKLANYSQRRVRPRVYGFRMPLPSGTVTLLFTDIEGSTRLWDAFPDEMRRALAIHDRLVSEAVASHDGHVVKNTGDGVFAAFADASNAAAAAVDAQRSLLQARWPDVVGTLGVRAALHTASMTPDGDDYHGSDVNRVARIEGAGHGGQILMSAATHAVTANTLPEAATITDLGLHALRGLAEPEHIYQVTTPDLRRTFPPLRTVTPVTAKLPTYSTSFVGREAEIDDITALLADPGKRLVTLLGPGGIGKTRLSVEAARRYEETNGVRAHFFSLVGITNVDQVIRALGESMDFTFDLHISAAIPEKRQLFDRLNTQSLLLVLDNLEHVEGLGPLISEVLDAVPRVTILATSRTIVNIGPEWRYDVSGLADPLDLFIERAQQAGAAIDASGPDGAAALEICERLGGLPLAVELAAAWCGILSPGEIAEEITRDLDFLETTAADTPERHRSVRAVFDHSWRNLPSPIQSAYANLSVFTAPFDREAAGEVSGATTRELLQLVGSSLLSRVADDRYELHPLLREFAHERLDGPDAAVLARRHGQYYADLVLGLYPELRGSATQMEARDAMAAELDHLRTALGCWLHEWTPEDFYPLTQALVEFYFQHSWADAKLYCEAVTSEYERLEKGLTSPAYLYTSAWQVLNDSSFETPDHMRERLEATRDRSEAVGGVVWIMWLVSKGIELTLRGEYVESLPFYAEAVTVDAELEPLHALEMNAWHGWAHLQAGNIDEASELFEHGVARGRADQHELAAAFLISKYGLAADAKGDYEASITRQHEGREIFAKLGDIGGQGYTLSRLSQTYYAMGDFEMARRYALDGLDLFEEMNHRWGIAVGHGRAGFAEIELGRLASATEHFLECLRVAEESGLGDQYHYGVTGIARAAHAAGYEDEAMPLLEFEDAVDGNPYADMALSGLSATRVEREAVADVDEAVALARTLANKTLGKS